jgi:thiosulfate reductase cytochrome b subunit
MARLVSESVFNTLKKDPANLKCFECGVTNPTWASGIPQWHFFCLTLFKQILLFLFAKLVQGFIVDLVSI